MSDADTYTVDQISKKELANINTFLKIFTFTFDYRH